MIKTITAVLNDSDDLHKMIAKVMREKDLVVDRASMKYNPSLKEMSDKEILFNHAIFQFRFELPTHYPCLAKLMVSNPEGDSYRFKTEDVSWKWYYYNDIIFWETRMKDYKQAMKNKLSISEDKLDFIL